MKSQMPVVAGLTGCPSLLCAATAEELLQLHLEMKSWVGVPRTVRNSLTPEATVRHAEKMLPKDSRLRIFWPKDSQHGAMYLCHQGHVDLADSTTAGVFLFFICLLLFHTILWNAAVGGQHSNVQTFPCPLGCACCTLPSAIMHCCCGNDISHNRCHFSHGGSCDMLVSRCNSCPYTC